jgi:hypothetical protein
MMFRRYPCILSRLASPSNAAPLPADDSITNDFGSSPPATDARGMMGKGFNKVIQYNAVVLKVFS